MSAKIMRPATGDAADELGVLAELPTGLQVRLSRIPAKHLRLLAAEPEHHHSQKELFRDACILHDARFDADDQYEIIAGRFTDYYREIPEREIRRAIAAAAGERKPGARYPKANEKLVASLTANCAGSAGSLSLASPVEHPDSLPTAAVLDQLYGPADLICLGHRVKVPGGGSVPQSLTKYRAEFLGREDGFELIVPNPMTAPRGLTQDGRVSERCLANAAAAWTYQVIEFDFGTEDQQAALIRHLVNLGSAARLCMVVFSGGKSLHSWFDVSAMSPDEQYKFRRYAAAIGADPAMFSLCQFARLPNAVRRDRGTKQAVKYLAATT